MERDQEFVEYVVKAIVNHPDDVKTERVVDERGVLVTLHVNPEDMGYVIGRDGQTARAVRTLLKIVGAKANARINFKIAEPPGGRGPRSRQMDEAMGGEMGGGSAMSGGSPVGGSMGGGVSISSDEASVDDLGI